MCPLRYIVGLFCLPRHTYVTVTAGGKIQIRACVSNIV